MTLLPSESWEITGVEGDHYQVGPLCAAPGCQRPVDHKHHLWRRSFLGGDYWWVHVPGGAAIRNVVGLCWHHHEDVTGRPGGHRVWIKWIPGSRDFQWLEEDLNSGTWLQTGTLSLPAHEEAPNGKPGREAERCPTCGKKLKSEAEHEHEPGPRRPRKSWTMQVPDDAEDGAQTVDELVEGIADLMGVEEWGRWKRYHVVIASLVFTLQNAQTFQREWAA